MQFSTRTMDVLRSERGPAASLLLHIAFFLALISAFANKPREFNEGGFIEVSIILDESNTGTSAPAAPTSETIAPVIEATPPAMIQPTAPLPEPIPTYSAPIQSTPVQEPLPVAPTPVVPIQKVEPVKAQPYRPQEPSLQPTNPSQPSTGGVGSVGGIGGVGGAGIPASASQQPAPVTNPNKPKGGNGGYKFTRHYYNIMNGVHMPVHQSVDMCNVPGKGIRPCSELKKK